MFPNVNVPAEIKVFPVNVSAPFKISEPAALPLVSAPLPAMALLTVSVCPLEASKVPPPEPKVMPRSTLMVAEAVSSSSAVDPFNVTAAAVTEPGYAPSG